ncbi:MAG: secretin N-terminal domain-containing protein [Planctomycetaceae bacterium]
MQIYPLQHASAEELAEFLGTALQSATNPSSQTGQGGFGGNAGGGASSQQLRDTKSVVLEFLRTSGDVQKLVKSGLLIDVRISGEIRTNSLVVTAPKDSLELISELIRVLDQPAEAVASVKMIPLQSADAVAAVDLLTSLFEPQQADQLGVQLAGAEQSSSLVPLRFQADARSNTVIAYGGEEALTMVEAILLRLDAGDMRNRQVNVYKLRNAPATDVATAINTFLQSQRDLLLQDPDRVSSVELLEQDIVVTPEPVSNSLLISATPKYFDRIMQMARQLDAAPAQVMIQALLVEVELNDTDEFGVELGFQDSVLFRRGAIGDLITTQTTTQVPGVGNVNTTNIISSTVTPGFAFNNQPLGNNTAGNPSRVGSQGLANFGVGRVNGDLGFGGLVLSASSESVSVLIRALASRRNVRVLSRPQILALDNQEAQIQVGQQVPVVDGVTPNAVGVASPNVRQDNAGIILTVTPRISPEGEIVMVVAAEKSAFNGAGVPIFTDTAGNVFTSPIKDLSTAISTIKVPDGQTAVLGADQQIEHHRGTQGGPTWATVVRNLFRYDFHTERRTELLIFLTPRIIHGDGNMELVKQVEAERLHFFEDEAEAVHGPLYSVPRQADEFYPAEGGVIYDGGAMETPGVILEEPLSMPQSAVGPGAIPGQFGTAGGNGSPAVPTPLFAE